jgi:hypothetical protein
MCIATAIQTSAQSVGMFIGARLVFLFVIPNFNFLIKGCSFLIGFGLTFAANAAPMLVSEISYPTYRAPLTSLYNSLWYSGNIV